MMPSLTESGSSPSSSKGVPGCKGLHGTIVPMSEDSRRHPGGNSFSHRASGAGEGGVEGRDAWCPVCAEIRGFGGSGQA